MGRRRATLIERWCDGRSVLVAHGREIRTRVLHVRLGPAAIASLEGSIAITALSVAAPAAAAAPAPPAHLAFGSHWSTALTRLLLVEIGFLGRAGVMILVRD